MAGMKFKHGNPDTLRLLEGKKIRSVSVINKGAGLLVELDDDTMLTFGERSGPVGYEWQDYTRLEVSRHGRALLILES